MNRFCGMNPPYHLGYVPGFPSVHTQGETLDELRRNLHEVLEMLLEDGELDMDAAFVGTQTLLIGISHLRSCRGPAWTDFWDFLAGPMFRKPFDGPNPRLSLELGRWQCGFGVSISGIRAIGFFEMNHRKLFLRRGRRHRCRGERRQSLIPWITAVLIPASVSEHTSKSTEETEKEKPSWNAFLDEHGREHPALFCKPIFI
jgi:hypothetical protein